MRQHAVMQASQHRTAQSSVVGAFHTQDSVVTEHNDHITGSLTNDKMALDIYSDQSSVSGC